MALLKLSIKYDQKNDEARFYLWLGWGLWDIGLAGNFTTMVHVWSSSGVTYYDMSSDPVVCNQVEEKIKETYCRILKAGDGKWRDSRKKQMSQMSYVIISGNSHNEQSLDLYVELKLVSIHLVARHWTLSKRRISLSWCGCQMEQQYVNWNFNREKYWSSWMWTAWMSQWFYG